MKIFLNHFPGGDVRRGTRRAVGAKITPKSVVKMTIDHTRVPRCPGSGSLQGANGGVSGNGFL